MKKFVKNYEKIVILGIGNELRGDDALGSILARELAVLFQENDNVTVFDGGAVPENFTGAIRKEEPSHIIILDAVDMNEPPGHIRLVKKDEIANYSISTHAMPLSFLIKYLESTSSADITLLGIQPKNMNLIQETSPEVKKSIEHVIGIFNQSF